MIHKAMHCALTMYCHILRRWWCFKEGRNNGWCNAVQMRWHAFQFMMQQLDDELHSLHANLCLVLARYPRAEAL